MRVSEYVRRVAVTGHIVARPQSGYSMAVASQLRRIGVNLNQLTRHAHIHGELPPELPRLWAKLEALLDRILHME